MGFFEDENDAARAFDSFIYTYQVDLDGCVVVVRVQHASRRLARIAVIPLAPSSRTVSLSLLLSAFSLSFTLHFLSLSLSLSFSLSLSLTLTLTLRTHTFSHSLTRSFSLFSLPAALILCPIRYRVKAIEDRITHAPNFFLDSACSTDKRVPDNRIAQSKGMPWQSPRFVGIQVRVILSLTVALALALAHAHAHALVPPSLSPSPLALALARALALVPAPPRRFSVPRFPPTNCNLFVL